MAPRLLVVLAFWCELPAADAALPRHMPEDQILVGVKQSKDPKKKPFEQVLAEFWGEAVQSEAEASTELVQKEVERLFKLIAARDARSAAPSAAAATIPGKAAAYVAYRYLNKKIGLASQTLFDDKGEPKAGDLATAMIWNHLGSQKMEYYLEHLRPNPWRQQDVVLFVAALLTMAYDLLRSNLLTIYGWLKLDPSAMRVDRDEALDAFVLACYLWNYKKVGSTMDQETGQQVYDDALTTDEAHRQRRWWSIRERAVRMREAFREDLDKVAEAIPDEDERTDFWIDLHALHRLVDKSVEDEIGECRKMSGIMSDMTHGTGKLPISKFLSVRTIMPQGTLPWDLREHPLFLRFLGVLDESNEHRPAVLTENYIQAVPNCFRSGRKYSWCCPNRCEDILSDLEKELNDVYASPKEVLRALGKIRTKDARPMPPNHFHHLERVAKAHGGAVFLHGRLLQQFLHHAFPTDCPFPHPNGTTLKVGSRTWRELGHPTLVQEDTLSDQINFYNSLARKGARAPENAEPQPWYDAEEWWTFDERPQLRWVQWTDAVAAAAQSVSGEASVLPLGVGSAKDLASDYKYPLGIVCTVLALGSLTYKVATRGRMLNAKMVI